MAWYHSRSTLKESDGNKDWWRKKYGPGEEVPVSGIYRCEGCGREIASNKQDPFPPQNHHQHTTAQGKISWELNVRTDSDPG